MVRRILAGVDARARIIDAAVECLDAVGVEHTTISAVAERAGVSRPTVYAHFVNRQRLISEAVEQAASVMINRVVRRARRARSAAAFVVRATVAARSECLENRALAPIARPELGSLKYARESLSPHALGLAREFLAPLVDYRPELAADLDEIAETVVRFLLSLILFDSEVTSSEVRLRAYLRRRMVPALGLG